MNEEPAVNYSAELISKKVRREARLRAIIEQSALSYYWGDSLWISCARIAGALVLGYLCYRNAMSAAFGTLLVVAIGGLVESHRANRRLDAMLELNKIEGE